MLWVSVCVACWLMVNSGKIHWVGMNILGTIIVWDQPGTKFLLSNVLVRTF